MEVDGTRTHIPHTAQRIAADDIVGPKWQRERAACSSGLLAVHGPIEDTANHGADTQRE
jgi:hypothetical protein